MVIVRIRFRNDCTGTYNGKLYSYKSLDDSVQIGDYMVVDAPVGLEVVRVDEVSTDVFNTKATKYAVCKVDFNQYNEMIAKEKKLNELSNKFDNISKNADKLQLYTKLMEMGHISEEDFNEYVSLIKTL